MADDLGFNDVSFRGGNEIPTPNIDALAYNGIILDRFYTPPLCTPSRASLLTGRYPQHIGLQHNVAWNDEPYGLGLDQKLMSEFYKEAGYSTHLVGKWHLGFYQEQYTPTRRGFDTHFGYLGPWVDYFDHTFKMFDRNYSRGLDLRNNLEVDRSHNGTYATDMFTDAAIEIIQSHDSEKDKPLFLLVTHLAPHAGNDDFPLQAKKEDINQFSYIENAERKNYAAMVKSLDDSVGKIVESLVKSDLMDDTILIFYSDNGGPTSFKVIHPTTANNYPLRGQKGWAWEGGIRTDCIIYAPFLPSGVVRKELFHVSDFLPTLATLTGAEIKIDRKIDGIDLSSMLKDGSGTFRKEVITVDDIYGISSLIHKNYKFVNGTFIPMQGRADVWLGQNNYSTYESDKYVEKVLNSKAALSLSKYNNLDQQTIEKIRKDVKVKCLGKKSDCNLMQAPCLFDIENDPCEENNLANDKSFSSVLNEIKKYFNEHLKTVGPVSNKDPDPRCDPINFDGAWEWWETDSPQSTPTSIGEYAKIFKSKSSKESNQKSVPEKHEM